MAESIAGFQAELIQKIQYKASSKTSMDAFLFKNMRFFDLGDKGYLSKLDFFKGIAKCGVVIDTHDMDAVFKHYAGEDNKIYYRSFIQQLLFREEDLTSNASRVSHQKSVRDPNDNKSQAAGSRVSSSKKQLAESKIDKIYTKCETYSQVLDFIKREFHSEGPSSLLTFAVKAKQTDPKKTHTINRKTLQSIAPFLQNEHLELIFGELSENLVDIDYSVLVYDLKGQPEEQRIKQIEAAFNLLDDRREGQFPISYMVSRFMSKSQKQNFQTSVDLYARFQGIDDGVFTEDDFHDCIGFLSFDYDSVEAFKSNVIRPFYEEDRQSVSSQRSNRSRDFQNKSQIREEPIQKAQGDFRKNKESPIEQSSVKSEADNFQEFHEDVGEKDEKKSVSRYSHLDTKDAPHQNQLRDIESIILRIKKRLATKGTKGFLLFEKAMKNADLDRDTLLNYEEFRQVIKDQRIDITNTEIDHIFNVFDEQSTNLISFPEFMFTIRGKMPQNRRQQLDRLWHQVKLSEEATNFGKIKKILNFRNHPDVQNGRKYQQDIWKQIQETILTIQELNGAPRNDTISKAEFDEYLQNLSLSIIDDKLYESILQNFWRLESSVNISEKYAGSRKVFESPKDCYLLDHHRYVVKGGSVSQNAPFGTSQDPTSYFTEHHKL